MGNNSVRSVQANKIREEIMKKFDAFDYRINPDDELTFLQRAKRELTGQTAPDEFMEKLYKGYRNFIVEAATEYVLSSESASSLTFTTTVTPPPLIDEMWCLAILYSRKYQEMCTHLIGTVIDRMPYQAKLTHFDMFPLIWPEYDRSLWDMDRYYTTWIFNKHIPYALNGFIDTVLDFFTNNVIEVKRNDLDFYLSQFQSVLVSIYSKKDLSRPSITIPETHENLNPTVTGNIVDLAKTIANLLPPELEPIMQDKYSIGQHAKIYLQEYSRFMALIYFTKITLTPSEEVDQVWHLHQSFTAHYRKFCDQVYGRFIHHSPTVGGRAETVKFSDFYGKTLGFYAFMFKEAPPVGIWPCCNCRFNPANFVGSWYSLLRMFMSILKAIEKNNGKLGENFADEVLRCYFAWTGKNLFKNRVFKIEICESEKSGQGVCRCGNYWCNGCTS
jgi:hypothetical protein